MAIKKTTAVKKSDPPKKRFTPDRFIAGADYGKVNRKTKDYYYEEGGQGMGPLKRAKDMPSLDPKKTIGQLEKEIEFQRSLLYGSKNPITAKSIEKRSANLYGAAPKKKK
jgi:hypothetical protein